MIQRKRIFEKAAPSKDAQKIYVFCEGDTREKDYFDFFEGMSSNLEIIPLAPYDHKSSPNNLINYAELLFYGDSPKYVLDFLQNDIVWFVIDTDKWAEGGLIELLRSYCSKGNSSLSYKAWRVAQNAAHNFITDENGPMRYSTEVYFLGQDIIKYAGRELQIKKRTLI